MRKAELSAHGREAQNLSVDAYDVVGAAGGVAMPANEFRFLALSCTCAHRMFTSLSDHLNADDISHPER